MILSKTKDPWTNVFDDAASKEDHDLFKLHLRFSHDKFSHVVEAKLIHLLRGALIDGIIPVFKYINLTSLQDSLLKQQRQLQETTDPTERQAAEASLMKDRRYQILPYTIYLYDKPELNNFPKLAALCGEIEALLDEYKLDSGDESRLCKSDVALPPFKHVMCRQSCLRNERQDLLYVSAFDSIRAARSKAACEKSIHFKRLKCILRDSHSAKKGGVLSFLRRRFSSKEKVSSKEETKKNDVKLIKSSPGVLQTST